MSKVNVIKKDLKEAGEVHTLWYKLDSYLRRWYYYLMQGTKLDCTPSKRRYRIVDFKKIIGWRAMKRMSRFAHKNPDVLEVCCDDQMFSSSSIFLIPHKSKKVFMGTTMLFVPQNAPESNVMFLYPEHLNNLIKALQKLQRIQKDTKTMKFFREHLCVDPVEGKK